MKKLLKPIIFLMVISLAINCSAQKWKLLRYEFIGGIGTANLFGPVGGAPAAATNNLMGLKDIRPLETRPSLLVAFRYKMQANMALKLNLLYGYTTGTDKGSIHEYRSDFSYATSLFEQSVTYEYYFIPEDKIRTSSASYNRRGMLNNYSRTAIYAFAGIGGVFYIPKFTGTIADPANEFLKGGGYTPVIPVGLGLKYIYNEHLVFGFELGGRYTFTKNMEGYTSSYSKGNNVYWFGSFNIGYRLKTDRKGRPAFLAPLLDKIHGTN